MKRLLAIVVALAFAVPCLAQTAQPPKPGPEHKKLAIWLGDWTYGGEYKETPLGPAGKFSGKESVRSVLGGFFVEWRGEEKGPSSTFQWLEIDGYDPLSKRFAWNSFASDGGSQTATYTFEGNTLTYSGTQLAAGRQYQIRGIVVFSPDLMSFVQKGEMSADGKTWMPLSEYKATKTKPSPK